MELLLKLMRAPGASGNEENVREIISEQIKNYVDEVKIDKSGNLIAVKKGSLPKVMLAAHMDEVGLMVKRIEANGSIRCSGIGDINAKSLIGQKVRIGAFGTAVNGIIKGKKSKKTKVNNLVIKTKFSRKELLSKSVEAGNYISFECESRTDGKRIYGKALDNRIGCFILIELAKKLQKAKNEIYFVFTVQEEIGLYGAITSSFEINPDWAIAIDVTDAADIPKECIGLGPVVTVKDSDFIANKCINGWLRTIAKKHGIALQPNVSDKGTTDATSISLSRGGVPSSVVGVCVDKMHTLNGTASARDIENAINLLYELIKNPPKVCLV